VVRPEKLPITKDKVVNEQLGWRIQFDRPTQVKAAFRGGAPNLWPKWIPLVEVTQFEREFLNQQFGSCQGKQGMTVVLEKVLLGCEQGWL
jgi:hypothetical protein